MLDNAFVKQFVDALIQIPVTETFKGRSNLLKSLPSVGLNRSEEQRRLDLNMLVEQLDKLGRVKKTGVRPLIVVAENALEYVEDWDGDLTTALKDIIEELERYYGGEIPSSSAPLPDPEVLVFKGRDERVSPTFLESAIRIGRSVVRLQVPRIFNGNYDDYVAFGTGWLIAHGLLITNHHVIDARELKHEPHALPVDFQTQAEHTTAWFDYHREGGSRVECQAIELVCSSVELDYALLRLKEANKVADRRPLPLIQQQPALQRGKRLNIVQHPHGGPLLYAIRSNFYVSSGDSSSLLHYLTDTEPGSSGSPVLDDVWQVLALHHAATRVSPKKYDMAMQGMSQEEVVMYNNEGIAIHSILDDLPTEVKQEILKAQGW